MDKNNVIHSLENVIKFLKNEDVRVVDFTGNYNNHLEQDGYDEKGFARFRSTGQQTVDISLVVSNKRETVWKIESN